MKDANKDSSSDDKYVILRSYPSRLYAEMLLEVLKKEGIEAIISGDDIGIMLGSYSTTSPVTVTILVPQSKLRKARSISEQMMDHF